MLGDGLLAAIAAFSMTAISDLMIAYSGPIQLFGGALLIVFGIGLLFARPMLLVAPGQKSHLWDHWGIIPAPSPSPSPIQAQSLACSR